MHSMKRALVVFATAAMAATLWTGTASASRTPSPWLQTGFNAANSNANTLESTLTPSTAAKVKARHKLTVSGDNQCDFQAGAAFSDDYTYVVDGTNLSKFSSATGKRIWKATADDTDEDYFDIAISHGLAIVSGLECGTTDPNGDIEAFNTTTGKRVWFVDADADGINGVAVSGKDIVSYSVAGDESAPQFNVFDVQSGKPIWSTGTAEIDNLCDVQPGVIGGLVYEQWCPNGDPGHESLRALNAATGKTVWSKSGAYSVIRGDRDTTSAHHLYVTNTKGQVLDLNPKSGATRFTLSGATSVLAVDSKRAYAPCGPGHACAYSVGTGKKEWAAADRASAGSAIVGGAVLYLDDGLVLNAATGAKVTAYPAAPSLVGNGRLAVISGDTVTVLSH